MTIDLGDLLYIVIALIPGFIVESIARRFIPHAKRDHTFTLFSFIVYSILCYIPPFVFAFHCLYDIFVHRADDLYTFLCAAIAVLVLWPVVAAFIFVYLSKWGFFNWLQSVFHVKVDELPLKNPPIWYLRFLELSYESGRYVTVTLKNGTVINGRYDTNSYASKSLEIRDLYIEAIYDEEWHEIPDTDGIYINGDEIVSIEFNYGQTENEVLP